MEEKKLRSRKVMFSKFTTKYDPNAKTRQEIFVEIKVVTDDERFFEDKRLELNKFLDLLKTSENAKIVVEVDETTFYKVSEKTTMSSMKVAKGTYGNSFKKAQSIYQRKIEEYENKYITKTMHTVLD